MGFQVHVCVSISRAPVFPSHVYPQIIAVLDKKYHSPLYVFASVVMF